MKDVSKNLNKIDHPVDIKDENFDNMNSNIIYRKEDYVNDKNKETKLKFDGLNNPHFLPEYEDLLRKHESDIRNHIKVQHQYRIYSDNLKNKIEELEKSKVEYKKTISNLQEVIYFINSFF